MSDDVDRSETNGKSTGPDGLDTLLNLMKIELERFRDACASKVTFVRRTSPERPNHVVIPEGFSFTFDEVTYLSTETSKSEFATDPKNNLSRGRTKRRIVVFGLEDLSGQKWQLTIDYLPGEDGYRTQLILKRKLGGLPIVVNHGRQIMYGHR